MAVMNTKQLNNARISAALLISIIASSSHHNNSIIHPVIAFNFGEQRQLFPLRRPQYQIRQSLLYSTVKNNEGKEENDLQEVSSLKRRRAVRSKSVTSAKAANNNNDNNGSDAPPQSISSKAQAEQQDIEKKPNNNRRKTDNRRHIESGAPYQRAEMLEHTILTKEEEFMYGRQVVRARELRESILELVAEKRLLREVGEKSDEMEGGGFDLFDEEEGEGGLGLLQGGGGLDGDSGLDQEFLSYELEYLSLYGFRPSIENDQDVDNDMKGGGGAGTTTLGGLDLEDDLLIDHAQHRSHHMAQLRNNHHPPSQSSSSASSSSYSSAAAAAALPKPSSSNNKRGGYRNGSSSISATNNNSYAPLLHIPIHELSESDIIYSLNIPGGKAELINILLDGAYAREVLMRRNVKLVTSIAKNWMRNSFSTANANLGSSSTSTTSSSSNGGKATRKYLSQMYEGSWDRPSLDEAVQEGILGLARAVDKYDPERGLRFSTYATHWITSYVRVCFQRAVTGCLRVPSQLHDIKAAYQRIVKEHLVSGEEPPEQTVIAKTLGITPQRLSTAIRATGSLVSVDAPVISPGSGSYKGSAAGGDGSNSQELLILDTLKCTDPKPEDQVEISFLRQCLENAMASELTPYERDVLRLRLGLDSGTGKTVREIVEICGGGVTMADVRSAERRAFKKLRSPTSVHTHNLLAYLDLAGADTNFR